MAQIADKRVERSKAAVLAETYRQLTQSGISGVSIDEVSAFRRVEDDDLSPLAVAFGIADRRLFAARERTSAPDTGTLRGDVHALATNLAEQLQTAAWASVYPSIIDAAERDPEIATMQSELHKGFMAPFHASWNAPRTRGEIPSANRPPI